MSKTWTTEEFIEKCKNSLKIKAEYDYSRVSYIRNNIKVEIGCYNKEHGYFFITPNNFLKGIGCPKCSKKYIPSTEEFIEKIKLISPQYDYNQVIYKNIKTKVKVICFKHGLFLITPNDLFKGHGCAKCYGNCISNTYEFIQKAKSNPRVKKDYNYSNVEYKRSNIKVKIGCFNLNHGFFEITPSAFLQGQGCPICCGNKLSNTQEFIEKAKNSPKVKNQYDYSNVVYKKNNIKVNIKCLIESHGFFEVTPSNFLKGQGCPKCIQGFGEFFTVKVFSLLFNHKFIKSRPNWLINPKTNRKLELDGFCEKLKLAVEYQGAQHEEIVEKFGMTQEDLLYGKYRDQIKRDKCKEFNVLLIEVPQFGKKFRPESLKELIKQKCAEHNFILPDNIDNIVINVDEIEREFLQQKEVKLRNACEKRIKQ